MKMNSSFFQKYIVIIFIGILTSFTALLCQAQASGASKDEINWSYGPTISKSNLKKINKILVVVYPNLEVASEFYEDVLSVKLMAAKINIVSREKRDQEQFMRFVKFDDGSGKKNDLSSKQLKKNLKEKLVDMIAIAEATGADSLVVVTLVGDSIQKNVYDEDPLRITEVRDELTVHSSSMTMLDIGSGELVLAGYIVYGEEVSLAQAAEIMSNGLIQMLR